MYNDYNIDFENMKFPIKSTKQFYTLLQNILAEHYSTYTVVHSVDHYYFYPRPMDTPQLQQQAEQWCNEHPDIIIDIKNTSNNSNRKREKKKQVTKTGNQSKQWWARTTCGASEHLFVYICYFSFDRKLNMTKSKQILKHRKQNR
jgi:tRNA/tmRNA/rRNA uracil-C5-methylase (TrmA/RlmC/RlmD family)